MISQKNSTGTETDARPRFTERHLLILIMVVAVLLRLMSAVFQGNQVEALPGIWDQLSYDGLAQRIAAGYGFNFAEGHWPATRAGEPTAHWSYIYTLYLAGVYKVFGTQPIVARIIQAVIVGVLQTWFTWRIGRRIFGPTAGLIAAACSAVYIYFFYYGGGLLTESFYFVGICWTLDATMRIAETPQNSSDSDHGKNGWLMWLELGVAISITVLLRQVFLLFVPILFLWIWWNLPQRTQSATKPASFSQLLRLPVIKGLVLASLVIVLAIVPWTIRNYNAFDMFVPLNTNAGYAFFWGNHPIHGTSFVPIITQVSYHDLIPSELLVLNEAEIDRELLREGLGFVVDQPLRIALLSLSRAQEYFKFWPTAKSSSLSNVARVFSFGLALPFMLYGLWLSAKLVRHPQSSNQRAQIVLLYGFIVVYAGVHLISWALVRYRLPIDTVLLIFAGFGIANLLARFGLVDTGQLAPIPAVPANDE